MIQSVSKRICETGHAMKTKPLDKSVHLKINSLFPNINICNWYS